MEIESLKRTFVISADPFFPRKRIEFLPNTVINVVKCVDDRKRPKKCAAIYNVRHDLSFSFLTLSLLYIEVISPVDPVEIVFIEFFSRISGPLVQHS